ncbi:MAG: hypothetical protein ACR2LN_01940 [Candidatus Levyibacteriota bacterium]
MRKIFGIILTITLFAIFALQIQQVLADQGDKPITGPVTSPITSPACKPGFGFGDKNHCHAGPPGQVKDNKDNGNDKSHGNK